MSAGELVVPRRFRAPSASGNGGWTAGALAALLDDGPGVGPGAGAVTVRLSAPPPLDRPLRLVRTATGLEARDGDVLVASAAPSARPEVDVPRSTWDEAVAAAPRYRGLADHPFPECYACGHGRAGAPGDAGLELAPAPVGEGRTAAPWQVPDGTDARVVWAALDCPGAWTVDVAGRPMVLGTITAAVDRVPAAGERCVVGGALLRVEGRKVLTATALRTDDGEDLAVASAVWVRLDR